MYPELYSERLAVLGYVLAQFGAEVGYLGLRDSGASRAERPVRSSRTLDEH